MFAGTRKGISSRASRVSENQKKRRWPASMALVVVNINDVVDTRWHSTFCVRHSPATSIHSGHASAIPASAWYTSWFFSARTYDVAVYTVIEMISFNIELKELNTVERSGLNAECIDDMDVARWTTGDSHSGGIKASAETEVPTCAIVLQMVICVNGAEASGRATAAICKDFRTSGAVFIALPTGVPAEAGLSGSRGGASEVRDEFQPSSRFLNIRRINLKWIAVELLLISWRVINT